MNVVYTVDGDSTNLLMLRLSIESLLRCSSSLSNDLHLYVMYSDVDLEKLKATLGEDIVYYPFDYKTVDSMFPELPNVCNQRLYHASLSRWFIARLPIKDCWYVDTDILFNCPITQLDSFVSEGDLFVAFNRKDYDEDHMTFSHTSDMNGGIMYFNIEKFNSMHLFSQVLEFYRDNADKIRFVNQTCFDYLFDSYRDICHTIISDQYNIRMWNYHRYNELLDHIKIFHFNGEDKRLFFKVFNFLKLRDRK